MSKNRGSRFVEYLVAEYVYSSQWWEAIKKEMKVVRIAFKIMGNDEKPPPMSQFMKCHMIFNIKMEDFRRKARLVAGGTHDRDTEDTHLCKHRALRDGTDCTYGGRPQ